MIRPAPIVALLAACIAAGQPPREPYKDARKTPVEFHGPGRDAPEPAGFAEAAIGYFGPESGAEWRGATLALEEANRAGGYRGKPFRLVARWSEDPWRSGAAHVARLAFQDRVWAIVGGMEGAGTHLAEQVAAKALLPLVNPVATDRSIHMAGVPWMFSVVAGDDSHAAVLAAALEQKTIVLFSATDHDSRAYLSRLKPVLRAAIKMHVEFEAGRADLAEPAARAASQSPDAVVVIAAARDGARAVRALRRAGYAGAIAGGPWFGRAEFREEAGDAAEGAIYTLAGEPSPPFTQSYEARYQAAPDYAAACAYDAVRILVDAIRSAGLNRARIRDAIAAMKPHGGASGHIEWDEFGQNRRRPVLASLGRWTQRPKP